MWGVGEFLKDLVRARLEAGLSGGWKRFGKCLHDRAEGDGVALHEVAGADVSIGHIADQLADLRGGFAVVGQGSEGAEREVRDHGDEGFGDFAVEGGVIGK